MRKRTQLVGFEFGHWKHTQYIAEFLDNALDAIETFQWNELDKNAYTIQKESCLNESMAKAEIFIPGLKNYVLSHDMFTPKTIERFTGRQQGAVYGTPDKTSDGRTRIKNLFIAGTDQGYLGIIGSMLSGISIANAHVLY